MLRLEPKGVAKVWGRGRDSAWACGIAFGPDEDRRIGEVHHRLPAGLAREEAEPLLLKTLYAETMLSVQVHPDAATAARLGLASSKDEAWLVLEAAPEAVVGLGLREPMSSAALRAAVLDGSIVEAMNWIPVSVGEALMVPAGTIHAIGAGLTLFEVQQNMDVTYRLHDHGRGRALDIDTGLAVARREAWTPPVPAPAAGPGRETLASGNSFVMERVRGGGRLAPEPGRPVWLAVIDGTARIDGEALDQGRVARIGGAVTIEGGATLLLAQPGPAPQPGLWVPMGDG
ncbi:class I mannose-6-phosphate isomerase [Polymorphobacter sp.]|uniref:class I mannose-6-phosphate isomerase n=1 Tax=Polymorphobacter sp. TaxID=1909290 RepID=UPI003F7206D5